MYSTYFAPPFGTPATVIFCRFLHSSKKQKILIPFGNQDFTAFCFSFKWCHQESNRGHKDFQSFALPTELWHHCFSFAVAKVGIFFESTNFLQIFCQILFGFKKMIYLCTRKTETECSAVGSALRSGRRGRAFESPHSDRERQAVKIVCRFFTFANRCKGSVDRLSLKTWGN